MHEGTLKPVREKPTREELLSHYIHFVLDQNLKINTDEEVTNVERLEPEGFVVQTTRTTESAQSQVSYEARRVLFAIGAMALLFIVISRLRLPKVHHLFVEPYPYVRKQARVVGGGNSAAECSTISSEEARTQRWRFGERIGRTAIRKPVR